ncbi:MAG: hypothetical protein JO069_05505 [Verrucomicrobia bacterium]|nr:hypothetical protein [Verrucomicrobiota bacterium]
MMIAVTGFDDREPINQALLYRYIISYEPFNFKGDADDFPSMTAYERKVLVPPRSAIVVLEGPLSP